MGKTIRHTCEKWLRKPKANGARKGEVRPKALPPTSYDDLDVAGYDESEVLQILKKPRIKTKSKSIISLAPNDIAKKFLYRFQELY